MHNVFDFLNALGVAYQVHEHPPVMTAEEAKLHKGDVEYGESKNLFLRNKKGDKHYLVTLSAEKRLDVEKLGERLNERLSFASAERLMTYLGLTPGAVSPFGLINDTNRYVTFILDKGLLEHEKLGFHPNVNTQTVILSANDFQTYLTAVGNTVMYEEV